jgi:arylsulfatase A-like enzyme
LAAWFGLVTGLLELAILLVWHALAPSSVLGALQMNRHFLWMTPVTHLAIFLTVGMPFAVLAYVRPVVARRIAVFTMCALAVLATLLTVKGLYAAGAAVLALGVACRITPWLEARAPRFRRLVLFSLPVLLGVVGILAVYSYDRLFLEEQRSLAALPSSAPGSPNVLLIVLDTVRADHLSLYGYGRDTTPNLARLASRGVVFQQARSTAPWTLPSHASMFTGRWPHDLDVADSRPLTATYPTLAELLAKHGYATAGFVGNTYFCNSWFGLGRGFAHYEDYYEHNVIVSLGEVLHCSALGRRLIELAGSASHARPGTGNSLKDAERVSRGFLTWLSGHQQHPFFVFLNYVDAHDPYVTPPSFDRHFGLRADAPADLETIQSWNQVDKKSITTRDLTLLRDAYDDCLAYLDEQLGSLFAELERRGVLEKTLVIITSDHGEQFGDHRVFGHGKSLYRGEVEVPLMVMGPTGVPRGVVINEPVSLRELAATVVERLGLPNEAPFPGRSLARFWDPSLGARDGNDDPILSEVSVTTKISPNPNLPPALRGPMASLVADGLVYLRDALGQEELYDLANDRAEGNNLAGSEAARPELERLRLAHDRLVPADRGRR